MRNAIFGLCIMCAAVTACSDEPGMHDAVKQDHDHSKMAGHHGGTINRETVELLTARFKVDACNKAGPVASMSRTGPDVNEVVHAYTAKGPCLDNLASELSELGFQRVQKGNDGIYSLSASENSSETVTITSPDEDGNGGIEWEVVEP